MWRGERGAQFSVAWGARFGRVSTLARICRIRWLVVDVIGDVDPVQALQLEDCSAVAVVLRQALAVIKEFGLKLSPPIELHDQHGRRWFSTFRPGHKQSREEISLHFILATSRFQSI